MKNRGNATKTFKLTQKVTKELLDPDQDFHSCRSASPTPGSYQTPVPIPTTPSSVSTAVPNQMKGFFLYCNLLTRELSHFSFR